MMTKSHWGQKTSGTCNKGEARFCQTALHPSAVIMADAVADTYATPSWVVVVGDFALRFV